MAKLELVAGQMRSRPSVGNHITTSKAPGRLIPDTKQPYLLLDRMGRQLEVRVVGIYGKELVIRNVKLTGSSKIMSRLKRYGLIEKAIIGTGIFDLFR